MKKRWLPVILILLFVCLFGCGYSLYCDLNRDYVAEQINKWNDEGKIPTDSFAFAWFECKGWQRYDSIIKLPSNVDKDSIVTDMTGDQFMESGGICHPSGKILSEGVEFDGAAFHTFFLCDVSDGVVMILSYFRSNWCAQSRNSRCERLKLTLNYSTAGEDAITKIYYLDYTVAPYIIDGHAYGEVPKRYDGPCHDPLKHKWD